MIPKKKKVRKAAASISPSSSNPGPSDLDPNLVPEAVHHHPCDLYSEANEDHLVHHHPGDLDPDPEANEDHLVHHHPCDLYSEANEDHLAYSETNIDLDSQVGSKDNTSGCSSTTGAQPGVGEPMWLGHQVHYE